jgi:hypothetical protein
MKTIFTLFVLTVALNFNSFSQQTDTVQTQKSPEQMQAMVANRQTNVLKQRLKLDEEQMKAVNAINVKYAGLRTEATKAARGNKDADIRTEMLALNEKRESEIMLLLNEEQTQAFATMKQQQQERREKAEQRAKERQQREKQN